MPFSYRKSVKVGPLRVNFSKTGVGLSAGVKGFRVSTNSRGTYINAGRGGFSYRQKIGGPWGSSQSSPVARSTSTPSLPSAELVPLGSAPIRQLTAPAIAPQLQVMNQNLQGQRFEPRIFAISLVIACGLVLANMLGIAILVALVGFLAAILGTGVRQRTLELNYTLDTAAVQRFSAVQAGCERLAHAAAVSQITGYVASGGESLDDAGLLPELISRQSISMCRPDGSFPSVVKSNIASWQCILPAVTLIFLPDNLLVVAGSQCGAVPYADLRVDYSTMQVAERNVPPRDAPVLRQVWRYATKSGGPDLRYRSNEQLYLCEYGRLHLSSATGLDLWVLVSSQAAAQGFAAAFRHP